MSILSSLPVLIVAAVFFFFEFFADKIQFIDKKTLEVARTLTVAGHSLAHSHFPEYTARGDYLYVSSGYSGDQLVIYDAHTLKKVKTVSMEVPAGIFSRLRARTVVVGLE